MKNNGSLYLSYAICLQCVTLQVRWCDSFKYHFKMTSTPSNSWVARQILYSFQKEFKCFSMWLFWGARYILQQFQKTQFIVRVFEKVTLPRHYKCKFKTKNKDQQFHYSLCYAKQRRLGFFDNSFSAYCSPSVLYTRSQLRIYVHENDWKWKLWKIRKEETLKYRVIMGQKNLKNRFPYS